MNPSLFANVVCADDFHFLDEAGVHVTENPREMILACSDGALAFSVVHIADQQVAVFAEVPRPRRAWVLARMPPSLPIVVFSDLADAQRGAMALELGAPASAPAELCVFAATVARFNLGDLIQEGPYETEVPGAGAFQVQMEFVDLDEDHGAWSGTSLPLP